MEVGEAGEAAGQSQGGQGRQVAAGDVHHPHTRIDQLPAVPAGTCTRISTAGLRWWQAASAGAGGALGRAQNSSSPHPPAAPAELRLVVSCQRPQYPAREQICGELQQDTGAVCSLCGAASWLCRRPPTWSVAITCVTFMGGRTGHHALQCMKHRCCHVRLRVVPDRSWLSAHL